MNILKLWQVEKSKGKNQLQTKNHLKHHHVILMEEDLPLRIAFFDQQSTVKQQKMEINSETRNTSPPKTGMIIMIAENFSCKKNRKIVLKYYHSIIMISE